MAGRQRRAASGERTTHGGMLWSSACQGLACLASTQGGAGKWQRAAAGLWQCGNATPLEGGGMQETSSAAASQRVSCCSLALSPVHATLCRRFGVVSSTYHTRIISGSSLPDASYLRATSQYSMRSFCSVWSSTVMQ